MEKSEVFTSAYLKLQKQGFCQGAYSNDKGNVCVLGSLDDAPFLGWEDFLTIMETLAETSSIVEWNDATERTKEEVLALLAQAESLLVSEENV